MSCLLYSDAEIAVAIKPAGLVSEDGPAGESFMPLLREELGASDLFPIHRLDKNVGGVMVYAKTGVAAAALSAAVQNHEIEKVYLAKVHGIPSPPAGQMRDLLFFDTRKNKTFVVDRVRAGVKEALLSYETIQTEEEAAWVRVILHTGRSHQIRAQFASRKLPLFGDRRYGARDGEGQIFLFSHRLSFSHPQTGETMTFSALPPFADGAALDLS